MINKCWVKRYGDFKTNPNVDNSVPFMLLNNFYQSVYICPKCGSVTYKTVFPIGKEYPIETDSGAVYLKRVFTCPRCCTFFAPLPGTKLAAGSYFEKSLTTSEYNEFLMRLNYCGTTVGRSDA